MLNHILYEIFYTLLMITGSSILLIILFCIIGNAVSVIIIFIDEIINKEKHKKRNREEMKKLFEFKGWLLSDF